MAYQQVGTPRFYVSVLQWLDALGKLDISIESTQPGDVITIENLKNIIKLNPTKQEDFLFYMFEWNFKIDPMVGTWDVHGMTYTEGSVWERIMPNEKNFQMTLGHDLGRDSLSSYINRDNIALGGEEEVVNSSVQPGCDYGGFSIMIGNNAHFPPLNDIRWSFTNYPVQFELPEIPWKIGALAYGTYYDMPNAPNLALTQSYEYAHRNDITTYNGSSISNSFQSKPPMWGDLGAWELSDGSTSNQTLSRTGRRTWNLSFSYMDDGDLWGSNQMLTDYLETSTGLDDDDVIYDDVIDDNFQYNLLTDDNFFSQVWHKTLGGTLPFVFQPNNNDNTNFAIARLKSNSLKAKRTSPNTYDISVVIEEQW